MRILLLFLFVSLFLPKLSAQPQVTITNGYVGKPILPLDSGYLFSRTLANDEIFYRWDLKSFSKTEILDGEFESTVWFRMTPFPIIATPSFRYLAQPIVLQDIQIQGPTIGKKVFYIKAPNTKGTVFLFHKEASTSNEWTPNFYDQFQLIKALHYYGYTVVFFDCEERATSSEINNDSTVNWQLLPHTIDNNVDFQTCSSVISNLRTNGIMGENEAIYAIGHGNGGKFAQGFADLFKAKACVVINSEPNTSISATEQTVPVLFNVYINDINVQNAVNQRYVDSLNNTGKCASIHYTRPTPLYPEVFARTGRIPIEISKKLFEELDTNGVLNDSNYLIPTQSELIADVIANPSKWPEARFLNSSYSTSFIRQLSISRAENEFNSNRVSAIVEFLEFPCEVNTSVSRDNYTEGESTYIEVNSAGYAIIPSIAQVNINSIVMTILGNTLQLPMSNNAKNEVMIDFTNQQNGIYFVYTSKGNVITIIKHQ